MHSVTLIYTRFGSFPRKNFNLFRFQPGIVRVSQSSRYYVHEERTGNLYRSERRKVGQWPDSRCHGCGCMCTGQKSGTAIDAPNMQPVLHSVLDFCQKLAYFLFSRRKKSRKKKKGTHIGINMGALCEWTRLFSVVVRSNFFGSFEIKRDGQKRMIFFVGIKFWFEANDLFKRI